MPDMAAATTGGDLARTVRSEKLRYLRSEWPIYLFLLPAIVVTFVFMYLPMPGIIVAFKEYNVFKGPFASPWNGIENFRVMFQMPGITRSITNTLTLSVLSLIVAFPTPIVFALLLNEIRFTFFKRTVQTISYLPYFLSWIAVIGIAANLYALYGPLNDLRIAIFGPGTERILFLAEQKFFIPNALLLTVWKSFGWDSVIYLAALTSINPELYEVSTIDGASKLKQAWHITLPGLMPTATILLILRLGRLFESNFELVYGLQNPFIDYEVIATVVFKMGIQQADYALATAVGLFQAVVAFILTIMANKFAKTVSGYGIW